MSSISAGTTIGTALVSEGTTDGTLVLKTNGTTTALMSHLLVRLMDLF